MATQSDKSSFTFFLPGSRVLSGSEVMNLPDEKRSAAQAAGLEGVWLEIPCPDDSCINQSGKICLPALGSDAKPDRGIWLNIFCPQDRCLYHGGLELP